MKKIAVESLGLDRGLAEIVVSLMGMRRGVLDVVFPEVNR